MSTTVQYKGNTLTTVSNATKTLKTAGKYMEGDVVLTDVSTSSAPHVWQDQDGYVHLDDEGTTQIVVEPLLATQNGTYTASTGHAYSPVTVNVSGGASSWTKIAEHTYTGISQTSTTATNIGTWSTGTTDIWTSDKILYIRTRDTAGKRNGYFYGTDVWVLNMYPENGSTETNMSNGMLMNIWAVTSSGAYSHRYGYSTTGYGVYPNLIYQNGTIRFAARYNSTYSLTINGDYKIEVYLLDPPTGTSIFT